MISGKEKQKKKLREKERQLSTQVHPYSQKMEEKSAHLGGLGGGFCNPTGGFLHYGHR